MKVDFSSVMGEHWHGTTVLSLVFPADVRPPFAGHSGWHSKVLWQAFDAELDGAMALWSGDSESVEEARLASWRKLAFGRGSASSRSEP